MADGVRIWMQMFLCSYLSFHRGKFEMHTHFLVWCPKLPFSCFHTDCLRLPLSPPAADPEGGKKLWMVGWDADEEGPVCRRAACGAAKGDAHAQMKARLKGPSTNYSHV